MTSYICVNIGCSSFLSIGILAARVGDSLQRLATTGILYLRLFSLFSDERHQQLAVVHHHSLNQIRKTLNSPRFPHFVCQIQFTSTSPGTEKQQKRGKGEICSEGYCRGRRWEKKWDVQMSFLWTKKSVVQMSEGKQEDDLSFGAVPRWKNLFVPEI